MTGLSVKRIIVGVVIGFALVVAAWTPHVMRMAGS